MPSILPSFSVVEENDVGDACATKHVEIPSTLTVLQMHKMCAALVDSLADYFHAHASGVIAMRPKTLLETAEEEIEDAFTSDAIVTTYGGRHTAIYAYERDQPTYSSAVPHIHMGSVTTSLCTESGDRPTIFVQNEEHFMDRLSELGILRVIAEKSRNWKFMTSNEPMKEPQRCAETLFLTCQRDPKLHRELEDDLYALKNTDGIFEKMNPEIGRLMIFGPHAIHAAGNKPGTEAVDGSLFVKNWRQSSVG